MKKVTKSELLPPIRVTPEIKQALEQKAAIENRSLTSLMRHVLTKLVLRKELPT